MSLAHPAEFARTPLFALTQAEGAKMTQFAGWEMPVQFSGLKQEHFAVRQQVGMFDISHMGKFVLQGQGVIQTLDNLVPTDLSTLSPGQAQYSVLLNPQAGIIDDIIIYNQGLTSEGDERVTLIVNAATAAKDKQWLLDCAPSLTLTDYSQELVLIALQGPLAEKTLQELVATNLQTLPAFAHQETTLLGESVFVARTGYTGEDGFEIMLSIAAGQALWQALIEHGVTPCGLGARDTLRLEAALGLYGQDMDEQTTPLEAGLGWLVHLDRKGDFIGRIILDQQKRQGVKRRLVALEMQDRAIARHGYPVSVEGRSVGIITSGTLSPTLNQAIALAYVPSDYANLGQNLAVEVRGKLHPARVVKKPFYRRPQ